MPRLILPVLHKGQQEAFLMRARFRAIRCGRRWGKTDMAKTISANFAAIGENIGWFTPDYKIQSESFDELVEILEPIKKRSSKMEGVIKTKTRGRCDFWTLNNKRAGRSRKYHKVIVDEGAFAPDDMEDIWEKAIKPALLDYGGMAIVLSTPNGDDPDNWFHKICTDKSLGFKEFHAPTSTNPYLPAKEIAKLKKENHPLVYAQEYQAEFVDWSGVQFFELAKMLVDGKPVPWPEHVDAVFAVIDSATKTGKEHDGTAVTYFAFCKHHPTPLIILDYDKVQIEGALLESWLPTIFQRLEYLAGITKARMGTMGTWIEDKASGMILLQQAIRRGWDAHPIDSKLTALGKDERAISVSGYVYQGLIKISAPLYDKVINYKGSTRNHFLTEILGFRIGNKDKNQEDDLLDTFCYGISIALGNNEGF